MHLKSKSVFYLDSELQVENSFSFTMLLRIGRWWFSDFDRYSRINFSFFFQLEFFKMLLVSGTFYHKKWTLRSSFEPLFISFKIILSTTKNRRQSCMFQIDLLYCHFMYYWTVFWGFLLNKKILRQLCNLNFEIKVVVIFYYKMNFFFNIQVLCMLDWYIEKKTSV